MARARGSAQRPRPDDEIIENALSRYLLERLLDKTQQRADLSEKEATRLAVEGLHAPRVSRIAWKGERPGERRMLSCRATPRLCWARLVRHS